MVGQKCWKKKFPFPAGLNAPGKSVNPTVLIFSETPFSLPSSPLPFLSVALQANETQKRANEGNAGGAKGGRNLEEQVFLFPFFCIRNNF